MGTFKDEADEVVKSDLTESAAGKYFCGVDDVTGNESAKLDMIIFELVGQVRNVVNETGASRQVQLADLGALVMMNSGSANILTLPANATLAIPVNSWAIVYQLGAGATSITAAATVSLRGVSTGSGVIAAQYGAATIVKTGTNTWEVFGEIGTVA